MLINIAIDGPSAAGKSTIAKSLASSLNYKHIDTGAMYRSVALIAKEAGLLEDEQALAALVATKSIDFNENNNILVDGVDVSEKIREHEVSKLASIVSQYKSIRELLVAKQQEMAKNKGYILDGRDIGSVVLPDAEVKIYLVASVESRAKRRFLELSEKGQEHALADIMADIEKRDYADMNREESPLVKADGAILVDSSNMNKEEVVKHINEIINAALA